MADTDNTLILDTTKGKVVIEMNPTSRPAMSRGSRNSCARGFTTASPSTA